MCSTVEQEEVIVIGAGIIGLTTAYELSKHFKKVTVVEKKEEVCLGASYQNGGVVNVESISPVNSYMNIWDTLKTSVQSSVTGKPANSLVRCAALLEPNLLLWVKHFLLNSSQDQIKYHAEGMRQVGASITSLVEELFQDTGFNRLQHNFHYTPGLLLSKVADPELTMNKQKHNLDSVYNKKFLLGDELEKVMNESGIIGLSGQGYNFGIVEPHNITVNTRRLGDSLREYLINRGVKFHFGSEVKFGVKENEVTHLDLGGEHLVADKYIVCAGYEANILMKDVGIRLPLLAIKSYSLHISNVSAGATWKYAVHIADGVAGLFTPYRMGDDSDGIRVTAIRDLDGYNLTQRPERVDTLINCARKYTGNDWDHDKDVKIWTGILPLSPDDFPMIGQCQKFPNLYLNVGHGFRGTAYSLPSARLLSQLMLGQSSNLCFDKQFADPARFGV